MPVKMLGYVSWLNRMVSLLGRDQGGKNTTFPRLKMPSHFTNKISQKGIQTKGLLVPKIHQEKGRHDYMEEGLTSRWQTTHPLAVVMSYKLWDLAN